MRLAQAENPLPPILVHRETMRVIDGIHRLMAALLRGQDCIDVEFFDGSQADAFLWSVEANVRHGLPLSQADRTAAALRILVSHPHLSDRAIAKSTGLGTRTVAELRRSSDAVPTLKIRVGRDGKTRPLNGAAGRLRAAELLQENSGTSLRQVAKIAGISPTTAADVRRRLARGEAPVPSGHAASAAVEVEERPAPAKAAPSQVSTSALEKLLRDPSLRHSEQGRRLLRMFKENFDGAKDMPGMVQALPTHCLSLAVEIARQNSRVWQDFARTLEMRAKIVDPWTAGG